MHCRIALNQITVCAKLRVRNLRRSGLFEEGDELLAELTRTWEANVVTVGVPYMGKAYAAEPSHSGDQPYFRYVRPDRRGGRWLPEPGCHLVTVREVCARSGTLCAVSGRGFRAGNRFGS